MTPSFDPTDTRVDLTTGRANTAFTVQYRDGCNNKTGVDVIVVGRITDDQATAIVSGLPRAELYRAFIPGQIGFPDLQNSFAGSKNEWNPEYDTVWHELTDIRYTNHPPTDSRSLDEIVTAFTTTVWDENYRPPFYETMVARYNARVATEKED